MLSGQSAPKHGVLDGPEEPEGTNGVTTGSFGQSESGLVKRTEWYISGSEMLTNERHPGFLAPEYQKHLGSASLKQPLK